MRQKNVIARMDTNVTQAEYAQRVVDSYTRGLICGGEVWNQMIDHATPDTLDVFMSRATPELHTYLQRVVLIHHEAGTEQERVLLQSLRDWYERPASSGPASPAHA